MEKSKEFESVTQKNTEIVRQNDILTEESTELSLHVENLRIKLIEYKSIEKKEKDIKLAKKNRSLKKTLKKYNDILNLTEKQQQQIGELENSVYDYWQTTEEGQIVSVPDISDDIKSILSDEQNEAWEMHQNQKQNADVEAQAVNKLAKYPISMNLTEEQKDFIFQNLYESIHPDTRTKYAIRLSHTEYKGFGITGKRMIHHAKEVLTEEQMEILIQSLKKSEL